VTGGFSNLTTTVTSDAGSTRSVKDTNAINQTDLSSEHFVPKIETAENHSTIMKKPLTLIFTSWRCSPVVGLRSTRHGVHIF